MGLEEVSGLKIVIRYIHQRAARIASLHRHAESEIARSNQ